MLHAFDTFSHQHWSAVLVAYIFYVTLGVIVRAGHRAVVAISHTDHYMRMRAHVGINKAEKFANTHTNTGDPRYNHRQPLFSPAIVALGQKRAEGMANLLAGNQSRMRRQDKS